MSGLQLSPWIHIGREIHLYHRHLSQDSIIQLVLEHHFDFDNLAMVNEPRTFLRTFLVALPFLRASYIEVEESYLSLSLPLLERLAIFRGFSESHNRQSGLNRNSCASLFLVLLHEAS